MKLKLANLSILTWILTLCLSAFAQTPVETDPERAKEIFTRNAAQINIEPIRRMPMQHNGRIKPLDTLSRETFMFVNGSYGRFGLKPVQLYLNMIVDPVSPYVQILEVRSPDLREKLGAIKMKRFFSIAELERSPLNEIAEPLIKKDQTNRKSLTEYERKVLETYSQLQVLKAVQAADHLLQSADFSFLKTHGGEMPTLNAALQDSLKTYLTALHNANYLEADKTAAELIKISHAQEAPEILAHGLGKIDTEIFYNDARLFLWSYILYLILGSLLFFPKFADKFAGRYVLLFYSIPLLLQIWGIGTRVYITKFAPVTNMYGTMIWVSLGVNVFSLLLYFLYRNRYVAGLMLIGSGLILMLTEQTPLVLSPDMDPIVAVLRSNYWLSTHVTTITISYAAFTIAMLLGNWALLRVWTHKDNTAFFKEYSHYAYRMIQLGCFLLTVGIILGGIWADESWGRFWGWDPKETWALIADLGFLAILHARLVGWVKDFTLLAWAPIAYLLVIMAWYGVNFVLAAGLHSYGFSSGGAALVVGFVSAQLLLLIAAFIKIKLNQRQAAA